MHSETTIAVHPASRAYPRIANLVPEFVSATANTRMNDFMTNAVAAAIGLGHSALSGKVMSLVSSYGLHMSFIIGHGHFRLRLGRPRNANFAGSARYAISL
jgi:hypothetical protein